MSLAVWPSVFIRFAVVMCSALATLRGRPNVVPLARDDARWRAVRSAAIVPKRFVPVLARAEQGDPDP